MIYNSASFWNKKIFLGMLKELKILAFGCYFLVCIFIIFIIIKNHIQIRNVMFNLNQVYICFPYQAHYIQSLDCNSLIMPNYIISNFELYLTSSSVKDISVNSNQRSTGPAVQRQESQSKEIKDGPHEHQKSSQDLNMTCQKNKREDKQIDQDIQSRNILPNNINLLFSYLRRINKSGKLINKIIHKLNSGSHTYTSKKFYSYQLYLKDTIQHDTSRRTLKYISNFCDSSCPIFSMEEQLFYNKVFRIAAVQFLRQESILNIMSSRKAYKTRKIDHLRAYRIIIGDMGRKPRLELQNY